MVLCVFIKYKKRILAKCILDVTQNPPVKGKFFLSIIFNANQFLSYSLKTF